MCRRAMLLTDLGISTPTPCLNTCWAYDFLRFLRPPHVDQDIDLDAIVAAPECD